MQFSENITLSAMLHIYMYHRQRGPVWGVSFICKLYRVGARTEPYGTPCISRAVDVSPSTITLNFLLERNDPQLIF
jgi:hypothetical protein